MRSLSALFGRNRFKFPGHTKDFKDRTKCNFVKRQTTRVKVGGNALARKNAQVILCTVVLYDKGGINQWASCLRVYAFQLTLKLLALDHMNSSNELLV